MGRGKTSSRRVRIIAGRWRGRRVAFPDAEGLRPTPDRARETLFNWLAPLLPGARVLDLFAGSGILALEALSRGAAAATAVDTSARVARRLRMAARDLDAAALEVVVGDAQGYIKRATGAFDIVFLDPPHADNRYEALCRRLEASPLMGPQTLVYLELEAGRASAFEPPASWTLYRGSRVGGLALQLWRRAPGSD